MIHRYITKEMSAIWSDKRRFEIWLRIELLVLEQLQKRGSTPKTDLHSVQEEITLDPGKIDEIEKTVKHDIIAFLTHVSEQAGDKVQGMHRGMTSNDLIDTAYGVQILESSHVLASAMRGLKDALLAAAEHYKKLPTIGRSHGMHAEPTSFGLKFLGWYAELARAEKRIAAAVSELAVGKIAGPVGTYASIVPEVESAVLSSLSLGVEEVPTQVVSRDRHASFFSALAILGGSIERWATEIRHLQRSEVAEAAEPFTSGQKGSSAMPHKRNPILCENLTGLARLLRGYQLSALENIALWHERDISHSSVERVITPDACNVAHFMLARMERIVRDMTVDEGRVAENLNASGGAVFSGPVLLALVDGGLARDEGYRIVQRAAHAALDGGVSLADTLLQEPEVAKRLSSDALKRLTSPEAHLAHVDEIFLRTKAAYPMADSTSKSATASRRPPVQSA